MPIAVVEGETAVLEWGEIVGLAVVTDVQIGEHLHTWEHLLDSEVAKEISAALAVADIGRAQSSIEEVETFKMSHQAFQMFLIEVYIRDEEDFDALLFGFSQ